MPKPNSLLDPNFKYVPARHTDIAKTFARLQSEQARVRIAAAADIPINKEEASPNMARR